LREAVTGSRAFCAGWGRAAAAHACTAQRELRIQSDLADAV